ncbi:hypothetical protein [Halorussus amylolyticus]|uniref:hypothetical protein n=1 Tax=Halorussus amylolyticus TaxID=1126242 RepID=UPI00104F657D|nr:hypothetical protein [Halorussus amylolyticus]
MVLTAVAEALGAVAGVLCVGDILTDCFGVERNVSSVQSRIHAFGVRDGTPGEAFVGCHEQSRYVRREFRGCTRLFVEVEQARRVGSIRVEDVVE